VTVAVPTLAAGERLEACLAALAGQTFRDFQVIVIDNSGKNATRPLAARHPEVRFLENGTNVGFGTAINQAWRATDSPFVAALNDDAVADPRWLESLVRAMEPRPDLGMCASQVRLAGDVRLDSAGMLIARDGSSKQRGHGAPPESLSGAREALLPSASAALYRRELLEETGGFDEHFFLYCEDTDLGLRARWLAWECEYVAGAVVEHAYSQSAGRASPLKAFYVERNRLFTIIRNFPAGMLAAAPLFTAVRYFWHLWALLRGRGIGAEYTGARTSLAGIVWRAHAEAVANLRRLWGERREIRRRARLHPRQFARLLARHRIGLRQVAEL
jgi:GT2 family glycosyltransferase